MGQDIISTELFQMEERRLYNLEAERGFLACIIRKPELIHEATRQVPVNRLYIEIHGYVYGVMHAIAHMVATKGWDLSFDPITMVNMARRQGKGAEERFYHRTDGLAKVRQLEQLSYNIDLNCFANFVRAVNDAAVRVEAYRQCRQAQMGLINVSANPDPTEVLMRHEARISNLTYWSGEEDESRITKLSDQDEMTQAKIEINHAYPQLNLFTVKGKKFPRYMHYLGGGFWRRGLTILQARPKTGKTTLLAALLIDVCQTMGCPGLFIDNEMSREEIYTRELSHISGQSQTDILAGRMLEDETSYAQVMAAVAALKALPIFYVNVADKPVSYIQSVMRQFRNYHVGTVTVHHRGKPVVLSNPSIVCFDWLKLPADSTDRNTQEYQALGHLASGIKRASTRLDLATIAAGQHNRDAVKFKTGKDWADNPGQATGGTDRLNQFASAICDLRNLTMDEQDAVAQKWPNIRPGLEGDSALLFNQMMHIPFNRNGPTCTLGMPLHHNKGRFTYEEVSKFDAAGNDEVTPFIRQIYDSKSRRSKGGSILQIPAAPAGAMP